MLQAPYEMQWRTDDNGVPYSLALEETIVVTEPYLCATLEEIPDSYQRLNVIEVVSDSNTVMLGEAMTKSEVKDNKYFVDYNNGVIYFSETMVGKVLHVSYYGRGFKRINAKRIMGLETNGAMTIDLGLEEYEERIKKLENLTLHLQKQINFLIDELESKGN